MTSMQMSGQLRPSPTQIHLSEMWKWYVCVRALKGSISEKKSSSQMMSPLQSGRLHALHPERLPTMPLRKLREKAMTLLCPSIKAIS